MFGGRRKWRRSEVRGILYTHKNSRQTVTKEREEREREKGKIIYL